MGDSVQAIRDVNTKLATFASSSTLVSYLDRPTVISALAIWAGRPHESTADASSIQSCEGVQKFFVLVKELETFSRTVPMPVMIDHLKAKKSTLEESFLIETFGMEFCKTNQFVTTTAPSTPFSKIVNQAMSVTKLFKKTSPSTPPQDTTRQPVLAPVTPATPATPALASVVTQAVSVTSVASKMSAVSPPPPAPMSPPGKATPGSATTPGSADSQYSRPDSVYGSEVKSFDDIEPEVMVSAQKGRSSATPGSVATPSASSETGGMRSPFPDVTPQNNKLLAEALKSPFLDATDIFGTAGAHSTPLRKVTPPAPKAPPTAASSREGGISLMTIVSIAAVLLTVYMQGQIKRGADLTADLPWVGKNNVTGLVMKQFETVEKAHVETLSSSEWKMMRRETNLTVETLAASEGGKPKYTKITALFDVSPAKLMDSFDGFSAFDATHKEVLPFYKGAELLLTPSSRIALMKATITGMLPTIPGIEVTFALVTKKSAKKPIKLDNVKLSLPSPTVIPHNTLIAGVVTVNSDSTGYAKPTEGKAAVAAPAASPAVKRCDLMGRLLVPNTTLCTAALEAWSAVESVEYYSSKIYQAVRETSLKMCGKSALCEKAVGKVFKYGKKATLGVVGFLQPPPVQTRVDAVYWFVPLAEGGTLMVVVAQGLNDMVSSSMALSYVKKLGH